MKKFSEWMTTREGADDQDERERRHVRHYDNGYETGFKGGHGDNRGMSDAEAYHYGLGHEHGSNDRRNGDEQYTSHVSGKPLAPAKKKLEKFPHADMKQWPQARW